MPNKQSDGIVSWAALIKFDIINSLRISSLAIHEFGIFLYLPQLFSGFPHTNLTHVVSNLCLNTDFWRVSFQMTVIF